MDETNAMLEPLFSMRVTLRAEREIFGKTPSGYRAHVYVGDGEFEGPRMRGRVRPVGGDWLVVRPDGVGLVDVRTTLESDDGGLVYAVHRGKLDFGENGYARLVDRKAPPRVRGLIAAEYETAHEPLLFLNRLVCVGVIDVDLVTSKIRYAVHALR